MQVVMCARFLPGHFTISVALLLLLSCTACTQSTSLMHDARSLSTETSGVFDSMEYSGRHLMGEDGALHQDSPDHDHDHTAATDSDHDHDHDAGGLDEHGHEHSATAADDSDHEDVGSGEAKKTVVKTAEELESAVQRGDEHIELQAHLDLTGLKMKDCGGGVNCLLGPIPASVKSIRVRGTHFSIPYH